MNKPNAEELLPWHVNGTLDPAETEVVESALKESEELREQYAFLKSVSEELKQDQVPEVSELGWRRLQKNIQAGEQNQERVEKRDWFKPVIAVAAMLLITLQIGILNTPQQGADTQLLSGSAVWQTTPHWFVQVEFNEDASWQQVHSLLNQAGAELVEGPSTLGIVRIAVPEANGMFATQQALLSWLREQSIVSHVAVEE